MIEKDSASNKAQCIKFGSVGELTKAIGAVGNIKMSLDYAKIFPIKINIDKWPTFHISDLPGDFFRFQENSLLLHNEKQPDAFICGEEIEAISGNKYVRGIEPLGEGKTRVYLATPGDKEDKIVLIKMGGMGTNLAIERQARVLNHYQGPETPKLVRLEYKNDGTAFLVMENDYVTFEKGNNEYMVSSVKPIQELTPENYYRFVTLQWNAIQKWLKAGLVYGDVGQEYEKIYFNQSGNVNGFKEVDFEPLPAIPGEIMMKDIKKQILIIKAATNRDFLERMLSQRSEERLKTRKNEPEKDKLQAERPEFEKLKTIEGKRELLEKLRGYFAHPFFVIEGKQLTSSAEPLNEGKIMKQLKEAEPIIDWINELGSEINMNKPEWSLNMFVNDRLLPLLDKFGLIEKFINLNGFNIANSEQGILEINSALETIRKKENLPKMSVADGRDRLLLVEE